MELDELPSEKIRRLMAESRNLSSQAQQLQSKAEQKTKELNDILEEEVDGEIELDNAEVQINEDGLVQIDTTDDENDDGE